MQEHNKIVKAVAKVRARRALNRRLLRPRVLEGSGRSLELGTGVLVRRYELKIVSVRRYESGLISVRRYEF